MFFYIRLRKSVRAFHLLIEDSKVWSSFEKIDTISSNRAEKIFGERNTKTMANENTDDDGDPRDLMVLLGGVLVFVVCCSIIARRLGCRKPASADHSSD